MLKIYSFPGFSSLELKWGDSLTNILSRTVFGGNKSKFAFYVWQRILLLSKTASSYFFSNILEAVFMHSNCLNIFFISVYYRKGKNAIQARRKLANLYGNLLPVRQCQNWFEKLRSSNFDVEDLPDYWRLVELHSFYQIAQHLILYCRYYGQTEVW